MPVDVTGARVLVIDDNPVNREILLEQLRSWSFDCAAAESGAVGLAFLDRACQLGASVDCIILDYQMPGMNGADVAKAIAADSRLSSIPVVLLTSVEPGRFRQDGDRFRHRRASHQAGAFGSAAGHGDLRHPEGAHPGRQGAFRARARPRRRRRRRPSPSSAARRCPCRRHRNRPLPRAVRSIS
ncbi:response regulator [Mesorhizobium atlanticum]